MVTGTSTSTAAHGDQERAAWDGIAEDFDRHTTPHTLGVGEQVVARLGIGPGMRVLDVAAGSGGVAIPAARAGAEVLAVDYAPRMVERLAARARAAGLSGLTARVGDGTDLELEDDGFDLVVSLNGISLFDDLPGGLREAVRVTRAGGNVAVVTFGQLPRVEFISLFLGAVRAVAPEALPPVSAGPLPPFRLADPAVFADTLEAAGLQHVTVEAVEHTMRVRSVDEHLDTVLSSNPIARRVVDALDGDARDELRHVLSGMLREHSGGLAGADLHAQLQLGSGTVPA